MWFRFSLQKHSASVLNCGVTDSGHSHSVIRECCVCLGHLVRRYSVRKTSQSKGSRTRVLVSSGFLNIQSRYSEFLYGVCNVLVAFLLVQFYCNSIDGLLESIAHCYIAFESVIGVLRPYLASEFQRLVLNDRGWGEVVTISCSTLGVVSWICVGELLALIVGLFAHLKGSTVNTNRLDGRSRLPCVCGSVVQMGS